tara:strand:+ start:130864 stop:131784 length:921 start_codon:yes stop_codon:yes gene_type:complete
MAIMIIGALIIGLTLGMLGSGGSAITVPVLVYLVGHGTKESIAESMAIVGLISIVAAVPYARSKQIDWRSVWYFGIPGMLGTFVGAWLGGISSEALQLAVFGGVLLVAAASMLRKSSAKQPSQGTNESHASPIWKIATEGTVVGIVTGFVGVGGGFLIVPALVLLGNLPIRLAIGTSLVIIAAKSTIGFAKYEHYLLSHHSSVDLQTILVFVTIGILGSVIGRSINARLNQHVLKNVFAAFLILLGGFVIVREGSKVLSPPKADAVVVLKANELSDNQQTNMAKRTAACNIHEIGVIRHVTSVTQT